MSEVNGVMWPGWETVRMIGRGGFGAVYEIQRTIFGDVEKAALKVISIPQNEGDIDELYSEGYDTESITNTFQAYLESIVAEYSLMRKLNGSTHIVNCDDVRYVQHDDGIGWDIFIKMELLTALPKALPAQISEDMVLKIAQDMCAALELCNEHKIIHRDIKPQNIFVSAYGDYKLGDFGIAKTVEKTMGGTKIGTYKYMAPEVYNNQPYGTTADIYSLGLVLYWLLNEKRMPFLPLPPEKLRVGMEEEARNRRLTGQALPEPAHGSDKLKKIVLKACAFDPKDRYQSAHEMRQALLALNQGAAMFAMPAAAAVAAAPVAAAVSAAPAAEEMTQLLVEEEEVQPVAVAPMAAPEAEEMTQLLAEEPQEQPVVVPEVEEMTQLLYEQTEKPTEKTQKQAAPVPVPPAAEQKSAAKQTTKTEKTEKKKKKGLVPIILAAVAVVIIVLVLLLLRSCGGDNPQALAPTGQTQPQVPTVEPVTVPQGTKAFTLNFDANGGAVSEVSREVACDTAFGSLPVAEKTGHTFMGWYTEEGEQITENSTRSSKKDLTVYAGWEVNAYSVSWDGGTGYTIAVNRTASVYAEAATGTLSSGDTVYYGDELSVTYAPSTGYQLADQGLATITVETDVTADTIYATAKVCSYTASWNQGSGYTIEVERTASPKAGAATGTLNSGDTVYYADVLSVTYSASNGHQLSNKGAESITVQGNVTSADIFAAVKVRSYTVSWNSATGCSITVKRTSSPNAGASTGTLNSGDTVYHGDVLSISYSAATGYTLSDQGATSVTVSENVTSSAIYAAAKVLSYTVSWNESAGYSVTVKRTSSPKAGASTGNLSNGATVYYGDTLTISYAAKTGYSMSSTGITSVTVSGNVTSSSIYASTSANSYTYNVVYKSSNGTSLGSTTVTGSFGSSQTISAPAKSGYTTPSPQTVVWDSTSAKTITFYYSPSGVSNPTKSGTLYKAAKVTYSAKLEYRNRTANSVEVRVVWTSSIGAGGYVAYGQKFKLTAGGTSNTTTVNAFNTWKNSSTSNRSSTGTSGWIKVSLNTTGATTVPIKVYYYQVNSNGTDVTSYLGAYGGTYDWTINIPAY